MRILGKSLRKLTTTKLTIVSSSSFRASFQILSKRIDSGYNSCSTDICNELSNLTFDDISNKNYLVRQMGDLKVIKLRIQNSALGLSSAAGYRLIVICNKKQDHVALLEIYPKKGKYSKSDLRKDEYKEILNTYGTELRAKTLIKHNIKKNLEIME
jgi:hypothetical protein